MRSTSRKGWVEQELGSGQHHCALGARFALRDTLHSCDVSVRYWCTIASPCIPVNELCGVSVTEGDSFTSNRVNYWDVQSNTFQPL